MAWITVDCSVHVVQNAALLQHWSTRIEPRVIHIRGHPALKSCPTSILDCRCQRSARTTTTGATVACGSAPGGQAAPRGLGSLRGRSVGVGAYRAKPVRWAICRKRGSPLMHMQSFSILVLAYPGRCMQHCGCKERGVRLEDEKEVVQCHYVSALCSCVMFCRV